MSEWAKTHHTDEEKTVLSDVGSSEVHAVCISLNKRMLERIDRVRKARFERARTDTIRFLILKALADLGYLTEDEKKALFWADKGTNFVGSTPKERKEATSSTQERNQT
jgi:hypothetical protein